MARQETLNQETVGSNPFICLGHQLYFAFTKLKIDSFQNKIFCNKNCLLLALAEKKQKKTKQ